MIYVLWLIKIYTARSIIVIIDNASFFIFSHILLGTFSPPHAVSLSVANRYSKSYSGLSSIFVFLASERLNP